MEKMQKYLDISSPQEILDFVPVLQKFVFENNLACTIRNKTFVCADAWKFAGVSFGIFPIVKPVTGESETVYMFYKDIPKKDGSGTFEGVGFVASLPIAEIMLKNDNWNQKYKFNEVRQGYKYSCECELVNVISNQKIGSGQSMCSNSEPERAYYDENAIMAMAQTRAISRAYRNTLGFLMKAAGFEPTPSEEMEEKYLDKGEAQTDTGAKIKSITTLEALGEYAEGLDVSKNPELRKIIMTRQKELLAEANNAVKKKGGKK